MSRKNQDNDNQDESLPKDESQNESLTDERNGISEDDSALESDQPPEDTIETVEEIEQIYEEIADDGKNNVDANADTDVDLDQQSDEGFEQRPVAPMSESSSGGKGMAGTAMGLSLLALAGTGYNLYDSNSSRRADTEGSQQIAVDYSSDIASIQEQINSLMESQQALTAMSASAQDESAADETAQPDSTESSTEAAQTETGAVSEPSADTAQIETGAVSVQVADETADTEAASAQLDSETALPELEQMAETEMATDTEQQADAQTDSDSLTQAASESAQQLAQQAQEIQAQVDALVSTLPSGDEIKNMAMEQVTLVLEDARKRLGLSEVAQLLSIGEQRLALARDVGGAQAALGMADQRLSEISDPVVKPVRESISTSLAELESLEVVDKNALTQELTNLSDSVDTLAFKPLETLSGPTSDEQAQVDNSTASSGSEQAQSSETQSGNAVPSMEGAGDWLKSIGSKVGNTIGDVGSGIADDLKGMVTIQKTGALSDVMLAPEQQYFIRENIKLQLGSAQRAVLQENTGIYKQSLARAQALLTEYFDNENEDVKSVSARLKDLEQINLELQTPDISAASASLAEVLRQLPSVGSPEMKSN